MARPQFTSLTIAIALSLTGIMLLDVMGAIIKHLVQTYPSPQLAVLRNFFGMFPSLLVLLFSAEWRDAGRPWRIKNWKLAFGRGLFITVAQICFYISLVHMAFATASTLVYSYAIFVVALSVPLLGDRVGIWRWSAVGIGFVGVLMIMRPGEGVLNIYAFLPLVAAFCYALSSVTVRKITEDVPSAVINLYSIAVSLAASTLFMLASSGFKPIASGTDWAWLIAMGAAGGTGVLCLIMAYRRTRPSNLAPFDYFGILFSFGLGWIFFAEAPFDRLFPGVILIVAGGLLIVWRERRTVPSD